MRLVEAFTYSSGICLDREDGICDNCCYGDEDYEDDGYDGDDP